MNYLIAYSDEIRQKVQLLIDQNSLSEVLLQKYTKVHDIRTDKALYQYVLEIKNEYMRNVAMPGKVVYDSNIRTLKQALGMHTAISRVQGAKLKANNEIRIASLFKEVPLEFLRMITVHELAHLKERDHSKSFYKLCTSMQSDYHQIEFDLRLYLTHVDLLGKLEWPAAG